MAIKIQRDICHKCKTHFLINTDCNGDYWYGFLQRYCPVCGKMKPIIGISLTLSNREKKKLANKIAEKYNLSYETCKEVAKSIKSDDEFCFLEQLLFRLGDPHPK